MSQETSVQIGLPTKKLLGQIALPGSKSITNRALLLAALSDGDSLLTDALSSDDTRHMITALRQLGVEVEKEDETRIRVRGTGQLAQPERPLFLGNAGTAMRFLAAASLLIDGTVVLDGDEHMRKRPIASLVDAMRQLGASVEDNKGSPPVRITSNGRIDVGHLAVDSRLSSQFLSGMMMAAACGKRRITITAQGDVIGGRGYIDITLAVMKAFGASIEVVDENEWVIEPSGYRSRNYIIEPDASAATYFWAAAKLTDSPDVLPINPSSMIQPDASAYALISKFPELPAIIDGGQIQDAVPTLAVMAAFNSTPVRFVGISNLRVKECDRINALATELCRLHPGLAEEAGDDLIVNADPALIGKEILVSIKTYADHRIAMSFALAGLLVDGIRIEDPACANKTYPGYWDDLKSLGVTVQ